MEMTELALAEMIKSQVTNAIQPYLQVKRPDGEAGGEDKEIFKSFGGFLQSVINKDAKLTEYITKTLSGNQIYRNRRYRRFKPSGKRLSNDSW